MEGKFKHTIDAKNRMFIPAPFREELGESFKIGISIKDTIVIYTKQKWDEYINVVKGYDYDDDEVDTDDMVTYLSSMMNPVSMDAQGRITIPAELCSFGGLEKEIMVIGAHDHLELWNTDKWSAFEQTMNKQTIRDRLRKAKKQS